MRIRSLTTSVASSQLPTDSCPFVKRDGPTSGGFQTQSFTVMKPEIPTELGLATSEHRLGSIQEKKQRRRRAAS